MSKMIHHSKCYGDVVFDDIQRDCRAFRFAKLNRDYGTEMYFCHIVSIGRDFILGKHNTGLEEVLKKYEIEHIMEQPSDLDRLIMGVLIDHQLSGDEVVKSFRNIIDNAYPNMKVVKNYVAGYDVFKGEQQLNREAIFDCLPPEMD